MSQRKKKSDKNHRLPSLVLATAIINLLIAIVDLIDKLVD